MLAILLKVVSHHFNHDLMIKIVEMDCWASQNGHMVLDGPVLIVKNLNRELLIPEIVQIMLMESKDRQIL